MRNILFRGKQVDNDEWVYGSLILVKDFCCILDGEEGSDRIGYPYLDASLGTISGRAMPVIPETVGQYTGLTDKNGKEIFEGDIIREYCWSEPSKPYVVTMENKERCGWYPFASGDGCGCCEHEVISAEYTKIVGNIHDNPELLGDL
jgi:uncharacterized phage protein (TIGR01671 family)